MYIIDTGCTYTQCLLVILAYFDSSLASAQDRLHRESEIRKAHVICVVYAIDNPHSFDRIPTYWLPYFRQLGVNVCVLYSSQFYILLFSIGASYFSWK